MIPVRRRGLVALVLLIGFVSISAHGQNAPRGVTIEYTLAAPRPISHLYNIELDIRGVRTSTVDVAMPAWAPGEYRIRDFARNVQEFSAETSKGTKLEWKQVDKQTWQIKKSSADDVRIRYRVYSSDLTDEMADLSAPAVFMYVVGNTRAPVSVRYDIPSNWKVYGGLTKNGDRYTAGDYDTLADSPAFLGVFKVLDFTSKAGVPYRIVFSNPKTELTERQAIEDLRDMADDAVMLFGATPYKNYTILVKVRGGVTGTESIEHVNSAWLTVGENDFVAQASYRRFIFGASRALVRAWLGRQIRPLSMSPVDYSKEDYSRLLWFIDGASIYYTDLLGVRSGFAIPNEYYAKLGSDIESLRRQAGRQLLSLEDASMNVWLRSDNTVVNTFSYLTKGELAALLLDLEIRGRTKNQKSLNDVVRYLGTNYGDKGVPEDGVQRAVTSVAGGDYSAFFDKVVRSTSELEYNASLQYAGLDVQFSSVDSAIYLGVEWERAENNQVRIRRVTPNSPADRAQFDIGDIVIALDSERVTADNFVSRIHSRRIGTPVTATLMRGERMLTTQITPGETKEESSALGETTKATAEQVELRKSWMGQ